VDLTVEKRLPLDIRAVLSGGIGASLGAMPIQRFWNLGGWQTVRGYVSGTQRGDAFWIGRGELLWEGLRRVQPSVFMDQGWAGARSNLFTTTPQLRSAGAGVAFFAGLFRLDAARSLDAGATWRVNSYAVTRF
jgi:hemolysin activation/secretion protein